MLVLVRVGVDICIQLSTVSSCLAGQVNNNNNMLSNELEGEKERKRKQKQRSLRFPAAEHCLHSDARTKSL